MKKQTIGSIIFLVAIIAVVSILTKTKTIGTNKLTASEEAITINGIEDTAVTVDFSDVTDAVFIADFNPGEAVDGGTDLNTRFGLWSNEYGEYLNFTNSKIDSAILLKTNSQCVIFNYESNSTTSILYEEITKYCNL